MIHWQASRRVAGGVGDDSFVHVCEFGQQRLFFGVAACCGQTTRLVHMALDPALHGPDHPQVQCIEMLLLRGRVDLFPMFDAFDQPAPSKPYSHFIIGGEVCVVADAADDVVSGNVLFQMVVRIIRIPFVGSHLGHEIHPPSCECIVGVDIYGVYGHQVAKVVRPCVVPVKRSVGVVRQDMPHPRGRYDTPVIILVEGAFDTYFFLRLRQLAAAAAGRSFRCNLSYNRYFTVCFLFRNAGVFFLIPPVCCRRGPRCPPWGSSFRGHRTCRIRGGGSPAVRKRRSRPNRI